MHTDTESSSCFPASSPPLPWKARLFTVIPAAYRRDDCKSPEYIFPMSLLLTFWVFVWMSLHQLQWVPAPCSFPHCFETPALFLCAWTMLQVCLCLTSLTSALCLLSWAPLSVQACMATWPAAWTLGEPALLFLLRYRICWLLAPSSIFYIQTGAVWPC